MPLNYRIVLRFFLSAVLMLNLLKIRIELLSLAHFTPTVFYHSFRRHQGCCLLPDLQSAGAIWIWKDAFCNQQLTMTTTAASDRTGPRSETSRGGMKLFQLGETCILCITLRCGWGWVLKSEQPIKPDSYADHVPLYAFSTNWAILWWTWITHLLKGSHWPRCVYYDWDIKVGKHKSFSGMHGP